MNEHDIKLEMNRFINGGPGSGNRNPGQGRGVGKPSTGVSKTSKFSESDDYLILEPTEKIREKARKAIIEVDTEYDDYDELGSHAYDLVEKAGSIRELRDILKREYGGSLNDSDIDKILEIEEKKSSYDEYVSKMSQYVKSKGKTSIDMTKTWSVEDAAKKYLEKADVSVKDFDDIYQLNVDYKNYSSSSPISKESKEKFKKDFSKAIVDAQEQIFGVDSSSSLISTPDIRKYVDDVKSKIEKELDLK